MELSDRTLAVLKNYANINPNIVFEEGSNVRTVSVARNVFSRTTVSEQFPAGFGIYDLNEFLNVLGLVDKPVLSFEKDYVVVGDATGRSKVKYFYSDPDMLTSPSKDINLPEFEVKFVLDNGTLGRIKRAAQALGHNEISIRPNNGSIQISVLDTKDATSNAFTIDVDGSYDNEVDFNFVLNVNNLKIVNEDFEVNISKKLISQFKSVQSDIEYFIALEKSSTFGV
jgi:hypothetical protein